MNNSNNNVKMEIKRKTQIKILTLISLVLILICGIAIFNNKEDKVNKIENTVKDLPLRIESTPISLNIVNENNSNILEATYTNDSEEIISKLVLEVKLKDTGEIIEMKCNEAVGAGETSTIFKGKAPASGNIEDVEVLKYKLSLRSGTYMEYDTELNQYNWS